MTIMILSTNHDNHNHDNSKDTNTTNSNTNANTKTDGQCCFLFFFDGETRGAMESEIRIRILLGWLRLGWLETPLIILR